MFVGTSNSSSEPTVENPHPSLLRIWPSVKGSEVTWPPGDLCLDLKGFRGIVDSFIVDELSPMDEAA